MWYQLNCYGFMVEACSLEDGRLQFECPFCDQPVELQKDWVVSTEKRLRTARRVWCPYADCDVPYEIKHSNFVAEEDETGHPMYKVVANLRRRRIHKVWRTRNDRTHNPRRR